MTSQSPYGEAVKAAAEEYSEESGWEYVEQDDIRCAFLAGAAFGHAAGVKEERERIEMIIGLMMDRKIAASILATNNGRHGVASHRDSNAETLVAVSAAIRGKGK